MEKLSCKVQVKNKMGLHTRPATAIVKMLQNCHSEVSFKYKKDVINPKSILSILMLAAKKNSTITIEVEGSDADEIMNKLVSAFENHFEEVQ